MARARAIRLMVNGSEGKMGARIIALARQDERFVIAAAHDQHDGARAETLAPDSFDVVVDFSSDEGAQRAARLAAAHRAALLVGTTGLSRDSLDAIEVAARSAPVMVAANTSLGIAVLNHLVGQAARLLGPDFAIDLVEAHHAGKRDAPSGTALRLAESIHALGGRELPRDRIQSIRSGDIVGEHEAIFAGPDEKMRISHEATSRDVFARGALRAAAWLVGQAPGRYTIEHSLGLNACV